MTDTTTAAAETAAESKPRRSGALSAMRLAELQGLATSMGITGTAKMRKSDLVDAIKARQSGNHTSAGDLAHTDRPATGSAVAPAAEAVRAPDTRREPDLAEPRRADRTERDRTEPGREQHTGQPEGDGERAGTEGGDSRERHDRDGTSRRGRRGRGGRGGDGEAQDGDDAQQGGRQEGRAGAQRSEYRQDNRAQDNRQDNRAQDSRQDDRGQDSRGQDSRGQDGRQGGRGQDNRGQDNRGQDNRGQDNRQDNRQDDRGQDSRGQDSRGQDNRGQHDDDDERGGRRRNRNRNRNRDKRRGGRGQDFEYDEPQVDEDDVVVPVAGILDVLDNYAFVRTSGYLPGSNDVYVPMGMVKRNGLRKGDAVTGAVKAQRDSDQQQQGNRQKFNPLVRLDTVNGQTPEEAKRRVEFTKLTPLYPQERLRLETEPNILSTRIIDLVSPIGKGQRGLLVSPPKAGKTMMLQAIANAITTNNPECHLMIVLIDERPEEVTDFQRTVKGEVIASTFDRPADDHTTVAELAIERAKRLVELGHDVVVLLDGITRLGRAYNLAAPASGRILSGGVDSSALYPPKKFFGAARNIEGGGSLTILATALVDTGSRMDEVIFEEFKGTGNMELRLSRQLSERRTFPAVDVNASSTRREEILLGQEELKIMWKLRRVLSALDSTQGIELLLDRLRKTKSNVEFLMQVQKTSSIRLDDEDD